MSQTKLGDAMGVTFQQIQKYENGTNRVSAGRLYAAAQHLGVTFDYFFEGLELSAAIQPDAELLGKNDTQLMALVRNFTQISDARARSAVVSLVGAMVTAEAAQAEPRRKPKGKDK